MAQMALRMNATVVPVGCNGSDRLYPGDSPVAKGGRVVYRIGQPLRPDEELAKFGIDEEFTPFTDEAEDRFGDTFQAMTELVMERIQGLLDERHLPRTGESGKVKGTKRFL